MKPSLLLAVAAVAALVTLAPPSVHAQAVTDQWSSVTVPAPPEVKPVTVDPKTTALLVMDFIQNRCTPQVRPRCPAALPHVARLLEQARARGSYIVYTMFGTLGRNDIASAIAAHPDETLLTGTVADKFFNTDLDKLLHDRGIKTVIATGTAANGAELLTVTGAALRGYKVIVPEDAMPGETPFVEAFSVWQMTHGPGMADHVTLTKADLVGFP